MKLRLGALLVALAGTATATCPPQGETTVSLQALKADKWLRPDTERQALALALLDCLSDPSPLLRDGIAFEGLQFWMRSGKIDKPTLQALRLRLMAMLAAPADPAGFTQAFAALVLAEVARVDRLQGHLSDEERAALVDQATNYLAGVRDYRGYDEQEGWRHGVAHGADVMLQLSLNKRLQRSQADALLAAIASQVLPPGEVAYRHGETDRLAAPVFYLAQGALLASADWERWFLALAERRQRTPTSAVSLAQRHNLSSFLNSLYVAVQEAGPPDLQARLLPGLRKALREAE